MCKYKIDPQGEIVRVILFETETFTIELYKEARLQWKPLKAKDYEIQEKLNQEMNRVKYWKNEKNGI